MLLPGKKCSRLFAVTGVLLISACPALAGDAYQWSVQYLVDSSRTVFGRPQKVSPRHNHCLAISPDGRYLYAGYEHSFNNYGEVRRIRIDTKDYERATEAVLSGVVARALTTDDQGRVYVGEPGFVDVFDAALTQRQFRIPIEGCEGIVTVREQGQLTLYATRREHDTISRFVLQESGILVTAATLSGFEGQGIFTVANAQDLRGLKTDTEGNLWVADLKGGRVFRISTRGRELKSVPVPGALDLAINGPRIFVSRSSERLITVLDPEVNIVGTLSVPWEELELAPEGNSRNGALGGIVASMGKGFFVANEAGQTRNGRSTYGRADDHSGSADGKTFRDVFQDDNEPILHAEELEIPP